MNGHVTTTFVPHNIGGGFCLGQYIQLPTEIVMKKIIYILKYQDGDYVQRDDSTGPMSSGGYPQRVRSIDDATKWNTLEDAARYGNTSGFREFVRGVFPLEVRYAEMPMVEFPIFWETCNHHCLPSKESQAFGALHYLDCTLRKDSQ